MDSQGFGGFGLVVSGCAQGLFNRLLFALIIFCFRERLLWGRKSTCSRMFRGRSVTSILVFWIKRRIRSRQLANSRTYVRPGILFEVLLAVPAQFDPVDVASPEVELSDIYKGVVPFIVLQLIGMGIVGYWPELVTWLPAMAYG